MNGKKEWKSRRRLTQTQTIALGFLTVILCGALLLMLPISAKNGQSTDFLSCLFTATTSTCVTGLIVVDTFTHWSIFGQCVILTMIQIGGMGFMTMGVAVAILLRRKISLKERGVLQESMNVVQIGGIVRLAKKVAIGVFLIEGIGALIFAIRFIPMLGVGKGIYYSIFHSVSAFCNAGIDLMGFEGEYSSFVNHYGDPIINLTIMALIIIGGIGFVVWDDITKKKWHFKQYMLHTKVVIMFTFILIIGGALLFYIFEKDNLMKDMSTGETILASLFSSVTPRTAGFNTIDTAGLSNGSKLLTCVLMFIGGSPGSTAGGIKTATVMVLIVYVWSNIRGSGKFNIFKRRLDDDAIKKASNVLCISLVLAVTALIAICGMQPELPIGDVIFEVCSAIGTAGMSTGVTRELTTVSRVIIILLMYCGRLGSMSFAMAFTESKKNVPVKLPTEKIMIG